MIRSHEVFKAAGPPPGQAAGFLFVYSAFGCFCSVGGRWEWGEGGKRRWVKHAAAAF